MNFGLKRVWVKNFWVQNIWDPKLSGLKNFGSEMLGINNISSKNFMSKKVSKQFLIQKRFSIEIFMSRLNHFPNISTIFRKLSRKTFSNLWILSLKHFKTYFMCLTGTFLSVTINMHCIQCPDTFKHTLANF